MTHAIIIPSTLLAAANARAVELNVAPSGADTFVVPLIPADGPDDAEPTYYACHGQINQAAYDAIYAEIPAWPGAMWWSYDNVTRLLQDTHADQQSNLGEPWDWQQSVAATGLKTRRTTPSLNP